MCAGGNVRSVALKFLLKYKYGHESLSCGQDANSAETIDMLCNWADYIVILTEEYKKFVPDKYWPKMFCYDVGPDRFGYAFNQELLEILDKMIVTHGIFSKI
jgi:predicted protein tyrosine phosphatase